MNNHEWPQDEHNQKWIQNVRPAGWVNPTPAGSYNLVVIGGGTAGLVTAAAGAGLGAKVALIEKNMLGGDCLNVGCVPSKTLLRAAHAIQDIHSAKEFGVQIIGETRIDFSAVMERVRRIRGEISPHDSAQRFKELGVDVYLGQASFTGPDAITVDGQTLRFKKAVIATGARAAVPTIPGLDESGYLTNETVFNLTEQPQRLLVVGGGPIGCELAQAFQALGSQAAQVEAAPRLLMKEDPDASEILTQSMSQCGVDVRLETQLLKAWSDNGAKLVELECSGNKETLEVDAILLAVGRRPNVEGLNLEAVGVEYNQRGVQVDETLRTINPAIYACGDICMPYQFTHAADFAARTVIRNALFSFLPTKQKWTDLIIPWCTYT
ncbi:FAD-dependent oxidoreductase, partial [bacterium]|nr:FAD-dependent oxidoreductase [bacterium]